MSNLNRRRAFGAAHAAVRERWRLFVAAAPQRFTANGKRLARKRPSLLGERIARADRAAWRRRGRHARDRAHFAVDTPELEYLAALAAELHGRCAGLKTRVEGDDQLIGAAREVCADADQPVDMGNYANEEFDPGADDSGLIR